MITGEDASQLCWFSVSNADCLFHGELSDGRFLAHTMVFLCKPLLILSQPLGIWRPLFTPSITSPSSCLRQEPEHLPVAPSDWWDSLLRTCAPQTPADTCQVHGALTLTWWKVKKTLSVPALSVRVVEWGAPSTWQHSKKKSFLLAF